MSRKGLYGLVVCGGQSTRMGMDKSEIIYYQKSQREHVAGMLENLCEKVYISCNRKQASRISNAGSLLVDLPEFSNIGPMAALLTANSFFPENDFLVLACDYPFIDVEDLQSLLQTINDNSFAAAFYHDKQSVYEPLIAWYSRRSLQEIQKCFSNQQYSLQRFLKDSNAQPFKPSNKDHLKSVDTPEDARIAKQILGNKNDFHV